MPSKTTQAQVKWSLFRFAVEFWKEEKKNERTKEQKTEIILAHTSHNNNSSNEIEHTAERIQQIQQNTIVWKQNKTEEKQKEQNQLAQAKPTCTANTHRYDVYSLQPTCLWLHIP